MKKIITLLLILVTLACSSQTISPAEDQPVCPHPNYTDGSINIASGPIVIRFEITFTASQLAAGSYKIMTDAGNTNKPVSCRVIQDIQQDPNNSSKGSCYIVFEDQRAATAKFTVVKRSDNSVIKTFSFNYIKSLKTEIKPAIQGPPTGYSIPMCTTGNIPYTFQMVRYKRANDDVEFGNSITLYEYSVPQGWQVNGQTSTGPNNYITSGPAATITYDLLNGGDVKIRAKQPPPECFVTGLISGEWSSFSLNRPIIALQADGSTAITINCGASPVTKNFTLINAPSCITNYTWNLGTDNGWSYQGIPAQSTFSTASNSIQLTSVCGSSVKNVSVTAYINSTAYGPYTVQVNTPYPTPVLNKVSGGAALCYNTSMTYVLVNIPCDASINWGIDQTGLSGGTISFTPNGNTVTLGNYSSGVTGSVTISYTVISNCGNKSGSQYVSIAPPIPSGLPSITGNDYLCRWQEGSWTAYHPQAYGYQWNYDINQFYFTGGGPPGSYLSLLAKPGFTGSPISVAATSPCGNSPTKVLYVPYPSQSWCNSIGYSRPGSTTDSLHKEKDMDKDKDKELPLFTLIPNPANDHVVILFTNTFRENNAASHSFTEIKIYDVLGILRKYQRTNDGNRFIISTTDLAQGVYFVELWDGTKKINKQMVIRR